ncbi:MAG: glycosyltransferase [Geobacter sp.]|nr:glycosyltransferase [Geobacter sp.]
MSDPALSIIIVSYNTKNDLQQCLDGLKKENVPLEVFVVDNGSTDGTIDMLRDEYSEWTAFTLILNNKNVGFTHACNQPLSQCHGEYVLFLNSDTIIYSDALQKLVDFMDSNSDVGVIGPKLYYGDKKLQLSCFYDSPVLNLLNILCWHLLPCNLAESFYVKWFYSRWIDQEQKDVGWVSGACLMIRRSVAIELKGFDDKFFLSAQDSLDLCKRVKGKNYRIVFYPKAEIIHYCGRSTNNNAGVDKKVKFLLHMHHGHLYYYRKHHGIFIMVVLKCIFSIISLLKGLFAGIIYAFTLSDRYKIASQSRIVLSYKILALQIPHPSI